MTERRMKSPLRINPAPFKSSFLAIPPSPFSPRLPLSPEPAPRYRQSPTQSIGVYPSALANAPSSPLSWVWVCHQCHRSYQLGVTRRCLDDGHTFCSGETQVNGWRKPANPRRVKKHRACTSEFDYQGWKTWGRWRRGGNRGPLLYTGSTITNNTGVRGRLAQHEEATRKDCWNKCNYPSECRWGTKHGIHTPLQQDFRTIEIHSEPVTAAPQHPEEGVLKPENYAAAKDDKGDFWGALIASAKRRKSNTPPSPLASVAEEVEPEQSAVEKDSDGDVVMTTEDSVPHTATSAAVDMLMGLMKRKTGRRARSLGPEVEVRHRRYADEDSVSDPESALAELTPLERVGSRDSGYQSAMDGR